MDINVIQEQDFDTVIASNPKVLVDFMADWCSPCKNLNRYFDELGDVNNGILIVKVNIEQAPNLIKKLGLTSVPTLQFYKDGKLTDSKVGLPTREEWTSWYAGLIG